MRRIRDDTTYSAGRRTPHSGSHGKTIRCYAPICVLTVAALCFYLGAPLVFRQPFSSETAYIRFDRTVPLTLTGPELDALVRRSEGARSRNRPLRHLPMLHLGRAVLIPHTPPLGPSCAVVGNSSRLRGSLLGEQIDRHDYVFRMNYAPVTGFEHDVGLRTTHHVQHARIQLVDHYPAQPLQVILPFDFLYDGELRALRQLRELPNLENAAGRLVIVHPDFIRYIQERWLPFGQHPWKKRVPSTGLATAVLGIASVPHRPAIRLQRAE